MKQHDNTRPRHASGRPWTEAIICESRLSTLSDLGGPNLTSGFVDPSHYAPVRAASHAMRRSRAVASVVFRVVLLGRCAFRHPRPRRGDPAQAGRLAPAEVRIGSAAAARAMLQLSRRRIRQGEPPPASDCRLLRRREIHGNFRRSPRFVVLDTMVDNRPAVTYSSTDVERARRRSEVAPAVSFPTKVHHALICRPRGPSSRAVNWSLADDPRANKMRGSFILTTFGDDHNAARCNTNIDPACAAAVTPIHGAYDHQSHTR